MATGDVIPLSTGKWYWTRSEEPFMNMSSWRENFLKKIILNVKLRGF